MTVADRLLSRGVLRNHRNREIHFSESLAFLGDHLGSLISTVDNSMIRVFPTVDDAKRHSRLNSRSTESRWMYESRSWDTTRNKRRVPSTCPHRKGVRSPSSAPSDRRSLITLLLLLVGRITSETS